MALLSAKLTVAVAHMRWLPSAKATKASRAPGTQMPSDSPGWHKTSQVLHLVGCKYESKSSQQAQHPLIVVSYYKPRTWISIAFEACWLGWGLYRGVPIDCGSYFGASSNLRSILGARDFWKACSNGDVGVLTLQLPN